MLAIVAWGGWLRWRGDLYDSPVFLRACSSSMPLGFVAVLAGWTTTEVGRQPWTVYGLLRTARFGLAVADRHRRAAVARSAMSSVYLIIYPAGVALDARGSCARARRRREPEDPIEGGRAEGAVRRTEKRREAR